VEDFRWRRGWRRILAGVAEAALVVPMWVLVPLWILWCSLCEGEHPERTYIPYS
jgi:hypothetical protein